MLCQTEMEYVFIQLGFGSGSYILMTDNKNDLSNMGYIWNVEKKAEYYAAAAKVQYMLIICINDFDTKFIREFDLIKKKQDKLQAKYSRTYPVILQEDIAKLTGF